MGYGEASNREDRGYREARLGWRLMIVIRKIVLLSINGAERVGEICIRASKDDGSGLLGLCDSEDHAYDVMIMIAGYYGL